MDAWSVSDQLDRLLLVDVRDAGEWQVGHIVGAIDLPEEDFDERSGLPGDRPGRAGALRRRRPAFRGGDQGFLRERMISEGKTPEEADAFLAEMGEE